MALLRSFFLHEKLHDLNNFFLFVEKLILFQIPENLKLNDLNEGHIGKIKIYKSGKIEFCVDEEKRFKVCLSVSGQFLQVKFFEF